MPGVKPVVVDHGGKRTIGCEQLLTKGLKAVVKTELATPEDSHVSKPDANIFTIIDDVMSAPCMPSGKTVPLLAAQYAREKLMDEEERTGSGDGDNAYIPVPVGIIENGQVSKEEVEEDIRNTDVASHRRVYIPQPMIEVGARMRTPKKENMISDEEELIEVCCGNVKGMFHRPLFLCPGIQQACIEVDGRMVTPKAFTVIGGKETLKNWKNAIHMRGMSIRKRMERGELDFYNHQETCTGKCLSRNSGGSKYDQKIEVLRAANEHNTPFPGYVQVPLNMAVRENHQYAAMRVTEAHQGTSSGQPVFPTASSVPAKYQNSLMTAGSIVVKQEPNTENGDSPTMDMEDSSSASYLSMHTANGTVIHNGGLLSPQVSEEGYAMVPDDPAIDVLDDSQSFWRGIIEVGVLDEFIREITTKLHTLKNDLVRTHCGEQEARRLSRVATELGLMTKLKYKLAAHKSETEKQKQKVFQEIEVLRRRMVETEQRQIALKRKSDCFDQLMELSRPKLLATDSPHSSYSNSDAQD